MFHVIALRVLTAALLGLAARWMALAWNLRAAFAVSWRGPSSREHLPARRVGPYLLENQIGAGGMGKVYRARHVASGGWCAVKLLPGTASVQDKMRFEREARLSSRVLHPNTIAVYGQGQCADGTLYYAMELVAGVTLKELVERFGPQPAERVIPILLQLCAALDHVHDNRLVHRDVTPDNVLITLSSFGGDRIKLLDFGLVKQLDTDGSHEATSVVGTPLYISPEAISAPQTVDGRADLYGLGAVAYFLLSGAPVFPGDNVIEVCSHHLHSEPASLSHIVPGDIEPELERIVLDCLAKEPCHRPPSAAVLAQRLREVPAATERRDSERTSNQESHNVVELDRGRLRATSDRALQPVRAQSFNDESVPLRPGSLPWWREVPLHRAPSERLSCYALQSQTRWRIASSPGGGLRP
jgi:eukaryotic-like serine/threonine-protein kinase